MDLDTLLTKVDTTISTWGSELNTRLINQTKTMEVWFQKIANAILGDPSSGDDLEDGSQQIQDGVADIGKFEEDQQAILDNNFDTIQSAVSITGFAASLAFVQKYTNMIFGGLGDVIIIFSMPLFLGLFFYICSRVPGATRWRPREPKGDSK